MMHMTRATIEVGQARSGLGITLLCGASFAAVPAATLAAGNPAEALELPTVSVVGTTPLPGLGTPIRDVPANVQIQTSDDIARQRHSNLTDFLEQNPTSVTVNAAQGNPHQPDVNFRGFAASPLLGTPQGLSVFQDGVRINEPFGDVVNWDLLPQSAISSIQIIPGSNPAYGLNTLGGALAIYTKSGSQYPGGSVEVSGGSFGRRTGEFEYGKKFGTMDLFVTGNYFTDDGWADHNSSTVKQLFGKVGWQNDSTDIDVSLSLADNKLEGTQTLPLSFFDNTRQAYTYPDLNTNKMGFLNVKGSHFLSDAVLVGGNLYYRKYKNENVSSNVNDEFGAIDPDTGAISAIQATNDRATIDQDSYGLGLQLTLLGQLAGRDNQFSIGTSGDFGKARFKQFVQDAEFTESRAALGIGDFVADTDADTRSEYLGVFVTDTLSLNRQWALTLSARYNRARVKIDDRSGAAPELNGDHTFTRFNPAIGLTFNPDDRLTTYASYNEGMRAPTPIELTCADPTAPCKLPNNFLADPPLKKVVAKTIEAGARGKWGAASNWSAAVYRTESTDDIQFISSGGAINAGYFANIGDTRRQGVELSAGTKFGGLGVSARYSYIDATFRTGFVENSPNNSSANTNGDIEVRPGNRIPGIPRHTAKLRLDYAPSDQWSLGANFVLSSNVFARGDENNQDVNGRIPGYAFVNVDGRYRFASGFELFARVNNLFDRRYANFGVIGENFFTGPNRSFGPLSGADPVNEQFRGLGAPRGIWVGVRYAFDQDRSTRAAVD